MPDFGEYHRNDSARIRAWTAHYRAKGCTDGKAYDVALRKVRKSWTWPPKGSSKR